jgi:hypothetical protein
VINEAEETTSSGGAVRFSYNNHWCGQDMTDNTSFGNGARVKYYDKNSLCNNQSPQGIILSGAKENGVQSFSGINNDPIYECAFPGRDPASYFFVDQWYIKPRMRINVSDTVGPPKRVIKIIINAYDGNLLDSMTIFTNDFRINGSAYNGSYIENYQFYNLSVKGDTSSTGINRGRPANYQDFTQLPNCHVDYQVYWYGEVSFWLDYVKVMDQPAVNLMGTSFQSQNFRTRTKAKVQTLLNEDTGNRMKGFYTEEIEYSNLACLKMEQDSLQTWFPSAGNKVKIISLIDDYSYLRNLNERHPSDDYAAYIQTIHPPAFMFTEYLFWYTDSPVNNYSEAYLPSNVSFSFPSYCPSGIQAQISSSYPSLKKSYSDYTTRLQTVVFDHYVDSVKNYKTVCDANGTDFHLVSNVCAIAYSGSQNLREPMNSEISAQDCIALCYGAKGLMPYSWESYYIASANESPYWKDHSEYQMGMADFDDTNHYYDSHKREHNYYGENKWLFVSTLYQKIQTWGSMLANSSDTQGYSGARDGTAHNYISDIKSIYRDNTSPYSFSSLNDDAVKYWEMGFFYPNYLGATDKSKYFMMVNRRCVPEVSGGDGDIRQLKIKFDSASLASFRNWKLIDVYTGSSVIFANSTSYLDIGSSSGTLGYFNPGEGKLFKLAPVMQEGGTLVTDESFGPV